MHNYLLDCVGFTFNLQDLHLFILIVAEATRPEAVQEHTAAERSYRTIVAPLALIVLGLYLASIQTVEVRVQSLELNNAL